MRLPLLFVLTALCSFSSAAFATGDSIVTLEAVRVHGEPIEEFGFRISPDFDHVRSTQRKKLFLPVVDLILPNTAASKAGLQPGDRIVYSDGSYAGDTTKALAGWRQVQKAKWKAISDGAASAKWDLKIERYGQPGLLSVCLLLPTQPPKWGVGKWKASKGRESLKALDAGILSERAGDVLSCGAWTILRSSYVSGFSLPYNDDNPVFLGYQWTFWEGEVGHRMFVSNQRGRTDIILEVIYKHAGLADSFQSNKQHPDKSLLSATTVHAIDSIAYHTDVHGSFIKAWRIPLDNRQFEIDYQMVASGFSHEIDFWRRRVMPTEGVWPLGVQAAAHR